MDEKEKMISSTEYLASNPMGQPPPFSPPAAETRANQATTPPLTSPDNSDFALENNEITLSDGEDVDVSVRIENFIESLRDIRADEGSSSSTRQSPSQKSSFGELKSFSSTTEKGRKVNWMEDSDLESVDGFVERVQEKVKAQDELLETTSGIPVESSTTPFNPAGAIDNPFGVLKVFGGRRDKNKEPPKELANSLPTVDDGTMIKFDVPSNLRRFERSILRYLVDNAPTMEELGEASKKTFQAAVDIAEEARPYIKVGLAEAWKTLGEAWGASYQTASRALAQRGYQETGRRGAARSKSNIIDDTTPVEESQEAGSTTTEFYSSTSTTEPSMVSVESDIRNGTDIAEVSTISRNEEPEVFEQDAASVRENPDGRKSIADLAAEWGRRNSDVTTTSSEESMYAQWDLGKQEETVIPQPISDEEGAILQQNMESPLDEETLPSIEQDEYTPMSTVLEEIDVPEQSQDEPYAAPVSGGDSWSNLALEWATLNQERPSAMGIDQRSELPNFAQQVSDAIESSPVEPDALTTVGGSDSSTRISLKGRQPAEFQPMSDKSMQQLALEWGAVNNEKNPSRQERNRFPDEDVQGDGHGSLADTVAGGRGSSNLDKLNIPQSASPIAGKSMMQLSKEWASRNSENTFLNHPREPVATKLPQKPTAYPPNPSPTMSILANEWSSMNQDREGTMQSIPNVPHETAVPPPPPSPPSIKSMEELAREWASMNRDAQ